MSICRLEKEDKEKTKRQQESYPSIKRVEMARVIEHQDALKRERCKQQQQEESR